jgi:hypothetical protein
MQRALLRKTLVGVRLLVVPVGGIIDQQAFPADAVAD